MARQRIHNRRAGRTSSGTGASWISYSDMMAALLLIFVLILTYSLYQYFTMLETKTKELNEQQLVLDAQQLKLDQQSIELKLANEELDAEKARLIIVQGDLDKLKVPVRNVRRQAHNYKSCCFLGNSFFSYLFSSPSCMGLSTGAAGSSCRIPGMMDTGLAPGA